MSWRISLGVDDPAYNRVVPCGEASSDAAIADAVREFARERPIKLKYRDVADLDRFLALWEEAGQDVADIWRIYDHRGQPLLDGHNTRDEITAATRPPEKPKGE